MSKVSFAIGDVVRIKRSSSKFKKGDQLVDDTSISTGCLQYAVGGRAWFDPEELIFVRDATEETLAQVIRKFNDERDEDEEDY